MVDFKYIRSVLILITYYVPGSRPSTIEKKLISRLLDGYNTIVRPVSNVSAPLTVRVGLTLMQIFELSERDGGQLKTNIWRTIEWNDATLVWNPTEYENITNVRIPYVRIWKPDIYVYNSVSQEFDATFHTDVVVKNDGNITAVHPQILTSSCKFSYNYFPYDQQKCEIKMGSWTYDGGQLDLRLQDEEEGAGGDMSSFIPNTQWELIGVPARRNAIYYACCPDPYVDVTFVVHVKRRGDGILTGAKKHNIFIFLTLFLSFLIPAASGHKITFATLHLINSWFPLWYYSYIFPDLLYGPAGSGLLIYYFNWVGILGALSFVANICTVCIYHNTWEIPRLIQKYVIRGNTSGNLDSSDVNGGSKHLGDQNCGVPQNQNFTNRGPWEWKYFALIVDRCFTIIFVLSATIIWITLFPSFS